MKYNDEYEILTDKGWSDFKGIKRFLSCNHRIIRTTHNYIDCSFKHKIYMSHGCKKAYKINVGDFIKTVDGLKEVVNIEKYYEKKVVYDFVGVEKNNRFYANNILVSNSEEFWAANYPTISASVDAKIIIISTPCGLYNLFHRIYSDGEMGRNSFHTMRVSWEEVEGRDEKWAEEQRKNMGETKFNQEYNVQFLGSANTVIDTTTLERLITQYIDPKQIDLDGNLLIYEKPQSGCSYVMGCDTAKGTGEHYSAIQVLKIISMKPIKMEQVALYFNNTIDVYAYADVINRLSYYYNNAYIMVENNSEGAAIVNRLWWDLENENLVNTGSKAINLGIRATKNSKPKAVLLMKKLIEDGSLILVDRETIEELTAFVDEGGRYFGKEKEDDAVSALYWACFILEMKILDESYEFEKSKQEEDGWGILSDINIETEDWSWLQSGSFRD
jgi:hypothetical protein